MRIVWKLVLVAAVLSLMVLFLSGCAERKGYDSFAQCITGNGVVMFGSETCPHCQNMKERFGNSFRFIEYVECNEYIPGADPDRCVTEGIGYLPTFRFSDGSKLVGELEFSILSQKTGCPLP
ncbi:MAG: thioredoxin family protein [Nanoarchaeota archaeon]|nr:thioredoxin family protein [Nanoarchaeota archaeon]